MHTVNTMLTSLYKKTLVSLFKRLKLNFSKLKILVKAVSCLHKNKTNHKILIVPTSKNKKFIKFCIKLVYNYFTCFF